MAQEGEPDVVLDVPDLHVGSIRLAVDGLEADLSVRARLANLLELDAGVRVRLESVELDLDDVRAEALLEVRLERLMAILDRALSTIDRNPQILETVRNAAQAALDDAAQAALDDAAQAALGDADQAVRQVTGSTQNLGSAVDQLGQQIGSVTAQATYPGEGVRGGAAQQAGPAAPTARGTAQQAAGVAQPAPQGQQPGPGERQPGLGGQSQGQQGGSPARSVSGTGQGREGQGQRGQGRAEQAAPSVQGPQPGQAGPSQPTGGRPAQGPQGKPGEGQPGKPGEGAPGEPGGGGPSWPLPSPGDLADQAGEVLRQVGRSVWDVIRSGVGQHGPQSKR
ncbi:hypothetical protein [Micromonospora sp. WMMD812]|uniref:hypothetical protein n=1 Tax=Micromonospora sp. WMMD812 TaxID=3015152 RepID=UPI00248C5C52|nr:hypothetical protein [Micromonospora sp. WMMD812]WBB65573.1 hypothetical protein O7603_20515 [Micromonospora sp. WMMD812]